MIDELELLLNKMDLTYDRYDIIKLVDDINYLKENGLAKISDRLLSLNKSRKFLEALTELKFTAQLLKGLPQKNKLKIEYEPKNSKRPIDLVVELDKINYYIQIKSLSNSIRENQQSVLIREIRKQSHNIICKREMMVSISDNFTKDNVSELMEFIRHNFDKEDGKPIMFNSSINSCAEIIFHTVDKPSVNHLILDMLSDLETVNITGMTREQIKSALINAAGAFEKNSSNENINLIVSEIRSDRQQAIDFAEALYGKEYTTIYQNGKSSNHRDNDGLFLQEDFAMKIAGIVVLHKKEHSLSSDYERVICSNPNYDFLSEIILLMHDKIIERYTWIDAGFFLINSNYI